MIKSYQVTYQYGLCAEKEISVVVEANTERKAKKFAEKKAAKELNNSFHEQSLQFLRIKQV